MKRDERSLKWAKVNGYKYVECDDEGNIKGYGFSRQTLENWGKLGILHVFTVMKNGKAHYVDEDTINALQDTIQDVARQRDRLETLKLNMQMSYI